MTNATNDDNKLVWMSVQLPLADRMQWGMIASTLGVSRSELVRQAVRFYIPILMARIMDKHGGIEMVKEIYGRTTGNSNVRGEN